MTNEKRKSFKVTLVIPEDCTSEDIRNYIDDAVGTWKGQLHPDNPLFDIDVDSIKVIRFYKANRYANHLRLAMHKMRNCLNCDRDPGDIGQCRGPYKDGVCKTVCKGSGSNGFPLWKIRKR